MRRRKKKVDGQEVERTGGWTRVSKQDVDWRGGEHTYSRDFNAR